MDLGRKITMNTKSNKPSRQNTTSKYYRHAKGESSDSSDEDFKSELLPSSSDSDTQKPHEQKLAHFTAQKDNN